MTISDDLTFLPFIKHSLGFNKLPQERSHTYCQHSVINLIVIQQDINSHPEPLVSLRQQVKIIINFT
jgi:hypothetical protein